MTDTGQTVVGPYGSCRMWYYEASYMYIHARIMAVHIGKPWASSHMSVFVGIVVKCGKVTVNHVPRYISRASPDFPFVWGWSLGMRLLLTRLLVG